jgi:vacuolar-type H+-ATPase subunit E/Vma4
MPTPESNAPAVLTQAVLDDARRQADAIIAQAQQQGAAVLAKATAEADQVRQERLKLARAEAARRTESIQASIAVEAGRLRAARVEALLQSLYDEAQRRLVARQGYAYREALVALVTEAARQMGGGALVVNLAPADRAAVADRLGQFTLVDDPALTEGGVVVLDADGRRVWDNRLPARLERLWPELRRQIVTQGALG